MCPVFPPLGSATVLQDSILRESLAKCVEKAKATDSTTKIKSKGNEHVWAAYLHVTIRTIQIQKNSNLMLSELVLSLDL